MNWKTERLIEEIDNNERLYNTVTNITANCWTIANLSPDPLWEGDISKEALNASAKLLRKMFSDEPYQRVCAVADYFLRDNVTYKPMFRLLGRQ